MGKFRKSNVITKAVGAGSRGDGSSSMQSKSNNSKIALDDINNVIPKTNTESVDIKKISKSKNNTYYSHLEESQKNEINIGKSAPS